MTQQVDQCDGAGNGQQHGAEKVNDDTDSQGAEMIRKPIEPPDGRERGQHGGIDDDHRPHRVLPSPEDAKAVDQRAEGQ